MLIEIAKNEIGKTEIPLCDDCGKQISDPLYSFHQSDSMTGVPRTRPQYHRAARTSDAFPRCKNITFVASLLTFTIAIVYPNGLIALYLWHTPLHGMMMKQTR